MHSGHPTSNEGRKTRKDTKQGEIDDHWYGMASVWEGLDNSAVFRLEETTKGNATEVYISDKEKVYMKQLFIICPKKV